ncbi:MAG: UDP-4-amino-4,6-dideoxy-N-acetyl-beta-L-altrosamine transaminase [Thermodesulfobacteriota bacterium]
MKIIPYSRQSINQDDIDAVCEVLRSDWLTQGPKVREFEEALATECGAKHCVAAANGTMALHLACLALDVGPGDTGLTSPITFLASANCIAYCGGRPDFADIDPDTLCLSPDRVEEYCRTRGVPKVVITVDFAGVPAALPRFRTLSGKYGFRLIEDAAHSLGSTYEYEGSRYSCGSCAHTDMAILSFHPVKTITTGEGGAVLTNDDNLAAKLRRLASHGVERDPKYFETRNAELGTRNPKLGTPPPYYYEMQALGFNARITDIQCALGLSQLKRIWQIRERRQDIVRRYHRALAELAEGQVVVLPPWPADTSPSYHLFTLRLGPKCRIERDELFLHLRERGIYCQVHYIPIYRQPYYRRMHPFAGSDFPESEKYYATCLSLPLFPGLEDSDFHTVVKELSAILAGVDGA